MQHDNAITVGAVSYCSNDWARLLMESVQASKEEHEIILVDNSPEGPLQLPEMDGVTIIRPGENVGHGAGLDMAIAAATGKYFLALDIDAHLLAYDWEDAARLKLDAETKILGARGGDLKPYRPCVSFFEREYFMKGGHSFENMPISTKGGFMTIDVGVFFALRTLHDGFKIAPLEIGESAYKDVWGDTYVLDGKPFAYHNWYGTRFMNGDAVIDGRTKEDMLAAKENLFRQIYKA